MTVFPQYFPELAPVFSKFYNKFPVVSFLPVYWKSPYLFPLFKNSCEPFNPSNYPIG